MAVMGSNLSCPVPPGQFRVRLPCRPMPSWMATGKRGAQDIRPHPSGAHVSFLLSPHHGQSRARERLPHKFGRVHADFPMPMASTRCTTLIGANATSPRCHRNILPLRLLRSAKLLWTHPSLLPMSAVLQRRSSLTQPQLRAELG